MTAQVFRFSDYALSPGAFAEYHNPNGKPVLELRVTRGEALDAGKIECRDEDGWHEVQPHPPEPKVPA